LPVEEEIVENIVLFFATGRKLLWRKFCIYRKFC